MFVLKGHSQSRNVVSESDSNSAVLVLVPC